MSANRPSIKRVVNVSQMRFQSLSNNRNFEARTKQETDLHRLNSTKSLSYLEARNKQETTDNQLTSYTLRQTSELDLDESSTIEKRNPIFNDDDEMQVVNEQLNDNRMLDNAAVLKIECEFKKEPIIQPVYNTPKETQSFKHNISNDSIKSRDMSIISRKEKDSLVNLEGDDLINSKMIHNNSNKSIFPQVAVSEVGVFEPFEDLSDDDMISHFELDIFSYKMGSFKVMERKNSDIAKEAKSLKTEMNNQFQVFELKSVDILFNLIAVSLYQKYWIAGCKNASQALFNKIHFGDEILSINDYLLNDIDRESFLLLAKNSTRPFITVKIKRLPYARIILIPEIKKSSNETRLEQELKIVQKAHAETLLEQFGIKLKPNTAKIEKLQENGLFYKNGLKYDSNKVEFDISTARASSTLKIDEKDRLTKWVITEINGDSVNYRCTAEEILTRLTASDTASVVVQPYDLVKGLYRERNKLI